MAPGRTSQSYPPPALTRDGDDISIADLLEMRSGLYNYTNSPELAATMDADPTRVWTPRELLDIAFAQSPNRPPGTDFEYSNTNYALVGLIIEEAGGQRLADAMHDRLFEPLGIEETFLPPSTSNRMPEPYSHGYLYLRRPTTSPPGWRP